MRPHRLVFVRAPLAAFIVCFSGASGAQPASDDTTDAADAPDNWQPFSRVETLDDGSLLTEYLVDTQAFEKVDVRLEASFSPRFGCDPMIGFVPGDELELLRDEQGGLEVSIDGVRVDWPSLLDAQAASPQAGWLFADRQQRRTMRLRIDTGDVVALKRVAGPAIRFSLLGSRAAMAAAEAACRAHEPIPDEGVD